MTQRLITGLGGLLLLLSPGLGWVGGASAFEFNSAAAVLVIIAGAFAVLAAGTGGRIGFFRPDASIQGLADMFGVAAAVVLAWVLFVDFPGPATREEGGFVALAGAVLSFLGAGDYSAFRGAPLFPRLK